MHYETVDLSVDDASIAAGDAWTAIEPVYWSANIYDGPEAYERSLAPFTRAQRGLLAVHWYSAEVNNGGHHQFYYNPTGIVWKDALEAFRAMDAPAYAEILQRSAERFGGSPSLVHNERIRQLETVHPDFGDLDDLFYEAEQGDDLEARMLAFARSRPAMFQFRGRIKRAVFPRW